MSKVVQCVGSFMGTAVPAFLLPSLNLAYKEAGEFTSDIAAVSVFTTLISGFSLFAVMTERSKNVAMIAVCAITGLAAGYFAFDQVADYIAANDVGWTCNKLAGNCPGQNGGGGF